MPRRPASPPQPAETLRLTTPEQIKAINHPLRLEILEAILEEARTVKQIADILGKPPTKLYYHMNALEAAGLAMVVETRVKSGILEKYYRPAALNFEVDRKLLKRGGAAHDNALNDMLAVFFDATADDLRRSWEAGRLPLGAASKKLRDRLVLSRSLFTLHEADIPKFTAKLYALLRELSAAEDKDGVPYGLTVAFYPRATQSKTSRSKKS